MTTVHYIEKYLKDGDKILDIGAGAGEYSLYFARKGYEVSALELADANIAAFKKKLTPEDKIDLVQGNALDLSRYADKSFDIVLLFGPLYHLKNDADKQKCISEAKRVCKDGGKIFFAFISNDFVFLTEFGYDVNYFSNGDYPELPHRAAQRGRGRRHLDDLPQKRRHAAPAPYGQNHAHPGRDVDGERLSDGNDRRPERAARHARARGGSKVGLHFAAARGDVRGWTDDEKFLLRSGRQRGRHDVHRHGDDRDARHSPLKHHERPLCGRRHGHRPFRERRSIPAPLHV